MHRPYKMVKDCVRHNPLPLLAIKDEKLLKIAKSSLKYDTGIEIECSQGEEYLSKYFRNIPNILQVSNDSEEQRYRIPNGINGLVCLYTLCETLKKYSLLNPASGIHYHIDCTDMSENNWEFLTAILYRQKSLNKLNWILNSLSSWNYKGTYNVWKVSTNKTVVRIHEEYKTIEFRIGEMSFDYEVLVKRIIHCQNIVHKLKQNLMSPAYRTKLSC